MPVDREKLREEMARLGFNGWYGRDEYDEHPVQGMWERTADAQLAGPLLSALLAQADSAAPREASMPTADREGLREALAEAFERRFPLTRWQAEAHAAAFIAGPLSALLAQADTAERMEAERDEARKRLLIVTADRDEQRQARLDAEADAETTDRWRQRALAAEGKMAEVARLSAEVEKRDKALKPFADLAETWVVQTAAQRDELLTVSNGERMCGIKATAFVEARTVLTRTTDQPDPGAREGSV